MLIAVDSTPRLVALDAVARAQAVQLVPNIASAFEQTGGAAEEVTLAYVLHGAVTVGLNHWTLAGGRGLVRSIAPLPHWFVAREGDGVELVAVEIDPVDLLRATKLAEAMGGELDAVLSAAACTGLETVLLGSLEMRGPWMAN